MYSKEFEKIFQLAKDRADDVEIMLSLGKSFRVRVHDQEIESFDYADDKGIGIRIIKDGKVGYAYTEEFSDEAFEMIVNEAIENSKYLDDEGVVLLSEYPDSEENLDIYTAELDDIDIEEKIRCTKELERIAKAFDKRVFSVSHCMYGDGYHYIKIANTKGLSKEYKANLATMFVAVLVKDGDDKQSYGDYITTRDFRDIDPEMLARCTVNKAIELLNPKPIPPGTYPVVFDNDSMSSMLSTFSNIFSSKRVQEGQSLLAGKIGEVIANHHVTIIDDALYPGGQSSRPFDYEGYPSQTTVLVEKGTLKNLLYNTQTAAKEGKQSTGNGSRSYKGNLTVSPSNLYIKQGKVNRDALFAKHDKVIEIVSLAGLHSGANDISGDFSLSAEGYLYEKGVKKHAIQQFTISGNFLDMLKNVELIANDFRFSLGSVGTSSTLVARLSISN